MILSEITVGYMREKMLVLIYLCGFFGLFVCFGVSLMTKMHSLVKVEFEMGKPCYIQSPMT